jgi:hypothetical protein
MSAELFPAFIKLENRPCLVVGAGAIATSKIASLLRAGAHITVVAPQAKLEVAKLAAAGNITWHQREFHTDDLRDIFLAIAATGSASVNREVFLAAQARGILTNAVDDPPHCDFYFPAVVRRGRKPLCRPTLSPRDRSLARSFSRQLASLRRQPSPPRPRALSAYRRAQKVAQPPRLQPDLRFERLQNRIALDRVCWTPRPSPRASPRRCSKPRNSR